MRRSVFPPFALVLLVGLSTLAACSGSTTPTDSECEVGSVAVLPGSADLIVGEARLMVASASTSNCTSTPGTTWTTSSADVARIDAGGIVTAVSRGSAVVTARIGGSTGTAAITVREPPIARIDVSPGTTSMEVGGSVGLSATTLDAQGGVLTGRTITWSSQNPTVATVDQTGLVRAVGSGQATIAAAAEGVTGTAVVTVSPAAVATVTVEFADSTLVPGQTVLASATLRDVAGNVLTGRAVTWATTVAAVATVDATGRVTARAAGTARIVAQSESVIGDARLSVEAAPANNPVAWAQISADGTVFSSTHGDAPPVPVEANRVAEGTYTVAVNSFRVGHLVWHVTADDRLSAIDRAGPASLCKLGTFSSTPTGWEADIFCENPTTGDLEDSDFRVLALSDNILGGTRAPGQRNFFTAGGSSTGSPPSSPLRWSSENEVPTLTFSSATGRTLHTHNTGFTGRFMHFVTRWSFGNPRGSCSILSESANQTEVECLTPDGPDPANHELIGLEGGRDGQPFGFARVSAAGVLDPARSRNSSGTTSVVRFGAGKYEIVFNDVRLDVDPAILISPAENSGYRACVPSVQSFNPVIVEVACWDRSGAFTDTSFNLGFLR